VPDTVCGPRTQIVTSERVQEVVEDAGTPEDWAVADGSLDGFQAFATRSTRSDPPQPMPRRLLKPHQYHPAPRHPALYQQKRRPPRVNWAFAYGEAPGRPHARVTGR
jgi:hypothetical protein